MADIMINAMIWTAWTVGAVLVIGVGLTYALLGLSSKDFFFTKVQEGWCKIVLTWGKDPRVIGPGLHWIGLPGIRTLYKRKMVFLKSVTDKDGKPQAEPHEDKDISSFKTTDYAYAFPFMNEEDSHGLPLSGVLAIIAILEDYPKAFFTADDWYSVMNSEIMPCFRDILVQVSYDDNIVGRDTVQERENPKLSALLWKALNREENGNASILNRLLYLYGIRVKSVQLRNVDPPENWRATTLAPYKAEREKAAAVFQAEASAVLFDDTNQALKAWLEGQRAVGNSPTQVQIEAKQDELRQRALAKTAGYQQLHIKGLENADTAVVGGAGVGVFGGGKGHKDGGGRNNRDQDDRGNNRRGNRREGNDNRPSAGQDRRRAEDMTTQELEAELARSTE